VPVLFANGACGDVNPVKIGETFADARRAGTIVGAEASRVLGELAAHGKQQVVHNSLGAGPSPKAPSTGALLHPPLSGARVPVVLPLKDFLADDEYAANLASLRAALDALPDDEAGRKRRAQLGPKVGALRTEAMTAPWGRNACAAHPDGYRTEVQCLRLGDGAAILTAPGELATEIGAAMRALSPAPETFVVGYANDACGYLMPDEVHDEGGYEAGRTLFTRGVQSRLLEAASSAIAAASRSIGSS
jgi:hypothetical protein